MYYKKLLRILLITLVFMAGCTYVTPPPMTEWDYKALEAGYVLKCNCCGETPTCTWVERESNG